MNCLNHPELSATAYCRTCGRPLCAECQRTSQGVIYCQEHVPPEPAPAALPAPGSPRDVSPGLACFLGFIPGVGAIYNGQYAKGLVHAVVFGLLVSILDQHAAEGLEALFGILLTAWIFYMALEAYHTARKRRAGEPVDEFSSLVNLHGRSGGFPTGAVALILLGVLLLLNTLGVLPFRYMVRYWPVLLILAGVWMLYTRLTSQESGREASHERR